MEKSPFSPDFFEDIVKLVENIPIVNNRFSSSLITIDSQCGLFDEYLKSAKKIGHNEDSISFRQVLRLFTKYLRNKKWHALFLKETLEEIRKINASYPIEYLLFDFCLAALGGAKTDAVLYLTHAFYILRLNKSLYLLLGTIINEDLIQDIDVKQFLTVLAFSCEPSSAGSHVKKFGNEYEKRYEIYNNEIKKLKGFFED